MIELFRRRANRCVNDDIGASLHWQKAEAAGNLYTGQSCRCCQRLYRRSQWSAA